VRDHPAQIVAATQDHEPVKAALEKHREHVGWVGAENVEVLRVEGLDFDRLHRLLFMSRHCRDHLAHGGSSLTRLGFFGRIGAHMHKNTANILHGLNQGTGARRFLLARPTGGLADMLAQIGRCIEYAQAHGRYLIIDTALPDFFADSFSHYFEFEDETFGVTHLTQELLARINGMSTLPPECAGRIASYKAQSVPDTLIKGLRDYFGHFVSLRDDSTQVPLTFDMRVDHGPDLLLHHCSGGGFTKALHALATLRPSPELRKRLQRAIAGLPSEYDAIHVRNTDLRSDYQAALARLAGLSDRPLLVCSDDAGVIDHARQVVPTDRLLLSSCPPDPRVYGLATRTLHKDAPSLPRRDVNFAAIIDLVCLARSSRLSAAELLPGQAKETSGFARLAAELQKSPSLLTRLSGD